MSGYSGLKIVYGAAGIARSLTEGSDKYAAPEATMRILKEGGVSVIDTAQGYHGSEEVLAHVGAPKTFIIDTKLSAGFIHEKRTKEGLVQAGKERLEKLQAKQVYDSHCDL